MNYSVFRAGARAALLLTLALLVAHRSHAGEQGEKKPRRSNAAIAAKIVAATNAVATQPAPNAPQAAAPAPVPAPAPAAPVAAAPARPQPAKPAPGKPGAIGVLTDDTFMEGIRSGVHLVYFWAEWCGPCRMQGPIVETVAKTYAGRVTVSKVDVDKAEKLSTHFNLRHVPSCIIFKDGKGVIMLVGLSEEAEFVEELDKLL